MEKANPWKALGAGFVATLAMTLLLYVPPLMGLPRMDMAALLGSLLVQQTGSGGWWAGLIWHFINGTFIFSLLYAYGLYSVLPGKPWAKGLEWGLTLWVLSEIIVMPLVGMGFFSTRAPETGIAIYWLLMGHLLYGIVLGAIVGSPPTRSVQPIEEKQAA